MQKILFIGCGAMGSALYAVWAPHYDIKIVDPKSNHPNTFPSIDDIPASYDPDIIVIAVKPQVFNEVIPPYTKRFKNLETIWVSIAAGKTLQQIRAFIPTGHVVRSMPNLPAHFGAGVTALVGEKEPISNISTLFKFAGTIIWLENESFMNAITALSGSGPAYIYYLTDCLTKAAMELGLPEDIATLAARQTIYGAGVMLDQTSTPASTLRENVTSPGGTTQAGLEVLMDKLPSLIQQTLKAAHQRSIELK